MRCKVLLKESLFEVNGVYEEISFMKCMGFMRHTPL